MSNELKFDPQKLAEEWLTVQIPFKLKKHKVADAEIIYYLRSLCFQPTLEQIKLLKICVEDIFENSFRFIN